jgi:hypothetical protein
VGGTMLEETAHEFSKTDLSVTITVQIIEKLMKFLEGGTKISLLVF